jgi:hypothetical protein
LIVDLRLKAEPSVVKDTTLIVDPNRAKERVEQEEPKLTKSNTLPEQPIFENDLIEKEDAM